MLNGVDYQSDIYRIHRIFRAGIAQLVEHNLAKVRVASSSLVSRSKYGVLTKRLCSGLQIRLARFDSGTRLQICRCGEIGRHKGFKIPRWLQRAGSTPAIGTINIKRLAS